MHKFSMVDPVLPAGHWGPFYRGYEKSPLSRLEQTYRTYIETSALPKSKARKIVEELDSSTPFLCRFEFVSALAALSAIFREDMDRKVTGANKKISHILWCAADPDRVGWLLNNQRFRQTLSLEPSFSAFA